VDNIISVGKSSGEWSENSGPCDFNQYREICRPTLPDFGQEHSYHMKSTVCRIERYTHCLLLLFMWLLEN